MRISIIHSRDGEIVQSIVDYVQTVRIERDIPPELLEITAKETLIWPSVKCPECHWDGFLDVTKSEITTTASGMNLIKYHCPECNELLMEKRTPI